MTYLVCTVNGNGNIPLLEAAPVIMNGQFNLANGNGNGIGNGYGNGSDLANPVNLAPANPKDTRDLGAHAITPEEHQEEGVRAEGDAADTD
jgi:hypothetical protein